MATSSFSRKIVLDTKESVDALIDMFENPAPRPPIRRNIISEEDKKRGEEQLMQILSHYKN